MAGRRFLILLTSFVIVVSSFILFSSSKKGSHSVDLTIKRSFLDLPFIEKKEERPDISILAAGDVMLGRTVMIKSLEMNDLTYSFRDVGSFLKSADLTFVNLENPIVENCPRSEAGFKFCADPKLLEGLNFAGVDIVNLANNHAGNYGEEGLRQTQKYLDESGIDYIGLENLVIKDIQGVRFGFLGFNFTSKDPTAEDYQQISEADKNVDFLFVSVHWGQEYRSVASRYQVDWGRKMIENGADAVIGHHPHWVQNASCYSTAGSDFVINAEKEISAEELKNGVTCPPNTKGVYYSLGNLVFDQMWSEETRKGLLLKFNFNKDGLKGTESLPIYMENWAQPTFTSN